MNPSQIRREASRFTAISWVAIALVLPAHRTQAAEKVLWDSWYTVTVGGKTHYGYYNDKVTLDAGKVRVQNQFWKKEEGFLNEEQLGAIATDDAELSPVFFSFRSNYRASETVIDGNVQAGRTLIVKVRKGGKEQPPIRRALPGKVVLSSLFPVWAGRNLVKLSRAKPLQFMAILEDNVELGYAPVNGRIRLEAPDKRATDSKAQKLSVELGDRKSVWWMEPNGNAIRIEMPDQKIVVERVTQSAAKNFLGE